MTKHLLFLFACLALTACAAPEDMLSDSMGAKAAAPAPIVAEEAPAVLERTDINSEECTGDGIGGTGCPSL